MSSIAAPATKPKVALPPHPDANGHVSSGQIHLTDEFSTRLLGRFSGNAERPKRLSPVELLTDREAQVFNRIG